MLGARASWTVRVEISPLSSPGRTGMAIGSHERVVGYEVVEEGCPATKLSTPVDMLMPFRANGASEARGRVFTGQTTCMEQESRKEARENVNR